MHQLFRSEFTGFLHEQTLEQGKEEWILIPQDVLTRFFHNHKQGRRYSNTHLPDEGIWWVRSFYVKTHRFQSTGFALVVTKEANRQTLEEECKDGADIAQMVISVCRNGPRLHPRKQPVIRQNGKEIGKKYYLNINKLQRSEATLILNSWERGFELDRWRSKKLFGKTARDSRELSRGESNREFFILHEGDSLGVECLYGVRDK